MFNQKHIVFFPFFFHFTYLQTVRKIHEFKQDFATITVTKNFGTSNVTARVEEHVQHVKPRSLFCRLRQKLINSILV